LGKEQSYPADLPTESKLSDEELRQELGIPEPEQQQAYDDAHQRAMRRREQFYNPTFVKPIDPDKLSDDGKAYRDKMQQLNREPTQLEGILGRLNRRITVTKRHQVLGLEIAQDVISEIFRTELWRKSKTIELTDDQIDILNNIIQYFIGDASSPYPLHKGLFVYGGYGVGKTFLFRAMQTLCEIAPIDDMKFQIESTKTLVQAVIDAKDLKDKDKKGNPMEPYRRGNLLLDDLGEERQKILSYGNQENPIDMLLSERYIAFDRFGHLTHVTSNLGLGDDDDALQKQLTAAYGSRVFDRMCDMFEFVLLPGESKRG